MTAFGLKASDSGEFADVLAVASSKSNTNVSLLGESFKNVAATAGAMGYSMKDTTTALGLMANAGVKGSDAVDSSEMAFKIAASMAFKEGMKKADPVIKEPIMLVNVIVPDEYLGFVIGDLSSRRGMVKQQESRSGGVTQVTADVPLAEMFGYATVLRSGTQGRGQYSMEPSHYSEVPKSVQEKIMNERAKN